MSIAAGRGMRSLFAVAGLSLLAGCAVGPDFHRPAGPVGISYTVGPLAPQTAKADVAGGEAQRFVQGMDIPGQWWTLFHSKPLDALIEAALKANPDIAAARAALRVAQENVYAQQGAYYPSVQANFTPTRNKFPPATLSPVAATLNPYYGLYTTQLAVSYVPDVFGLNRRTVEAIEAQAEAQRFELEAAYLSLTSNVVAAAVQEASVRGQIAATREVVRAESESLGILRRQLSLGQVAGADVAAQEAALAQALASLPPLRKQLAQQRDLLAALAGRFPSEGVAGKFELASLQLPKNLPVSLPAKLIEQRPDVRAAEAQLHSASAEIGVAVANMLPNVTLSANVGSEALQMGQLFGPGTSFWTLAGGLTQPIFEGGTLLHRTRAARAAYDEAASQYRSTVITAFQNVADALRALQFDAEAMAASATAERAAAATLDITRRQLALGEIAYLSLLAAEQTYQQAVINRVQAQAERYADTAALFQALGGGWWNRTAGGTQPPGASAQSDG